MHVIIIFGKLAACCVFLFVRFVYITVTFFLISCELSVSIYLLQLI